jgi:hypothetical protein
MNFLISAAAGSVTTSVMAGAMGAPLVVPVDVVFADIL